MSEKELSKAEAEAGADPVSTPPPPADPVSTPPSAEVKDVPEEKVAMPPSAEEKPDDSKALVLVEKEENPPIVKTSGGSIERDAVLARLATEKRLSLIKAWEENEKTKAENKAVKKLSSITAWENAKKAILEAELKRREEELEKQKAEYAEKIKNKIAQLHKVAEEKKAMVEARRGEEILKAEEIAAKHRATGLVPKKAICCFGP